MMNYIRYILYFILFWLSYFLINRILFILFFVSEIRGLDLIEIIKIFPNSIPLDLSFVSYLLSIIFILLWIGSFLRNQKIITNFIYYFNVIILLISGLINGGEISLYSEWNTKLNFTAISHFVNPSEVFRTASYRHILIMFISLIITFIFIRLFKIKIQKDMPFSYLFPKKLNIITRLLILPLMLGFFLLGIRGGAQAIPINLSDAYFSNNIILNDIAVNSNWNIVQSILKSQTVFEGNPYEKYPENEAEDFIQNLNKDNNDSTLYVLNSKDPNIVFILLESWSADNIESLGGLEGITPNFKSLEKEGLLFTDFYSNGWTSDQGVSAIFSSFPVFPYVSIINQPDKSRKLPCLSRSLENYHSSFFFGGQLTYGNIKGYLLSQGFNIVKDKDNYKNLPSGRLGVHDEFMFSEFNQELNTLPQPFLSTFFTISSHSPFDFPGEHQLSFDSKEDDYVNSVAYTDKCLGGFMKNVKDEDWYDNTLFIILADHSHVSPIKRRVAQRERYKIPMLWFGEIIKEQYKGTKYSGMGSHIDIYPSLLIQLDLDNNASLFGKDLFDSTKIDLIPYAFHKGYGIIKENGYYAFSESYNKIFEMHATDTVSNLKIKKEAELYFQATFKKYMDL